MDEIPMSARIIGLADTFDAMTSARPYREAVSVGGTLSELVRFAPQKFDPNAVQALLVQIRRDAVGSNRPPLLDQRIAINIAPADIDQLASSLQHKLTRGRTTVILPPS
jgi:HD-GYP domain-containing protein (c-di-GMP phosphodiesterase class II)